MAKLQKIENTNGQYYFICPGCGEIHSVWTAQENQPTPHPIWKWNGDVNNPTITPSLRVTWPEPSKNMVCHSIITNGKIYFCGDCTHKLKGQTVDLPEID